MHDKSSVAVDGVADSRVDVPADANAGPLVQCRALVRKQLILLRRSWFWTCFRALLLPAAYIIFMGEAKHFFVRFGVYGIAKPAPIQDLVSVVGGQLLAYFPSDGVTLTPEMHRVMDVALQGIPSDLIHVLDSPDDILSLCRQNLRGTSDCYGAIQWNGIDIETHTYNYTLRGNGGLDNINVGNGKSSADVFVLPLQWAVDKAIANFTVKPDSMPYTSKTEEDYKNEMNKIYMNAIINWLAPALFLGMVGVIYHLAGVVAQDREYGLTNLLSSMGVSRKVRMLAFHVSFSAVYLLGWIVIAGALSGELFTHTSAAIVIFYHLFSGLAMVSWSIFIGTLFQSTQISGIFASVFSVILAIVTTLQTRLPSTGPFKSGAVYALAFLFPPCNYSYFIATVARFQHSLLPTNMVDVAPASNIRVIVIFVAAIFQIFFFFVLATVADRFKYEFSRPKVSNDLPQGRAVQISGLTKRYDVSGMFSWITRKKATLVAVDDLTANIGFGQIVSLLGANGSGKTTTLEMISGIQASSDGSILLCPGSRLGICPQKNVLWENLNVREHIEIWASIKGTPKSSIAEVTDDLIERCDLTSKAKTKAGNLSGGQKRKLQLAIMFVGGSNVCCIDEATSGLDPLSRRKIWDILLENRGQMTLILTTHFLDEADLLSDNVFIMSKGVLKAEGPTLRLKESLGGGYTILVGKPGHQAEEVLKVESTSQVVDAITKLEAEGRQYRVEGPSLETAFLSVAQNDHAGFTLDASGGAELTDKTQYSASEDEAAPDPNLSADQIAEALRVESKGTVGLVPQTIAMLHKRFTISRRNPWTEVVAFVLPIIVAIATRSFIAGLNTGGCSPSALVADQEFSAFEFTDFDIVVGSRSALSSLASGLLTFAGDVSGRFGNGTTATDVAGTITNNAQFVSTFAQFQAAITANHSLLNPGGFYMNGSDVPTIAYQIDGFDFGTYTGPTLLNLVNNLQLNGTLNLVTNYSPFQNQWTSATGNSLQFVVYFGLAMSVAPAFVGLYPTFERLSKVRAMHYSNGLRIFPLWFAYTMFNFVIFVLSSAIIAAIIGSASSHLFGVGYLFVCLMLYGLSSILVSFALSLIVQSQLAAFAITAAAQAVYFLVYLIAYLSILAYGNPATINSNLLVAHFVMALFMPVANLLRALFVTLNLFGVICHNNGTGQITFLGDILAFGGPIFYLMLQVIVLFLGLLWWDSGKYRYSVFGWLKRRKGTADDESSAQFSVNPDVVNERERVDSTPELYDTGLRLSHISKVYDGVAVVDDVTYGVENGECFALLGPNGAGKTTTFNMIRGEVAPTEGEIFVNSISVHNEKAHARSKLGVCPQFDAMDKMTVVEILRFYAKLRGLVDINYHVDKIIDAVGVGRFRTRMAYKLSGGNKRKLSLAIALIGNPAVLLLDEPSSGMDAFAKRIMWKTLSLVSHGRSIVLTTHSMEEADALASRAGFLAKRLLAIGTTDELRDAYGKAHHLHMICHSSPNTTTEEMEAIVSWAQMKFPGAELEDKLHQGQIRLSVPSHDTRNEISAIFKLMEASKTNLGIESYTVSPTTLEEVFLKIVGTHSDIGEEE